MRIILKNTTTKIPYSKGRKRRMGFGKKGKNSFTVHRSEEVLPGDITRELRAGGGAGGGGIGGGAGGGLSRGSSSEADPIEHFFGDGAGGERCAQVQLTLYLTLSLSIYLSICLYCLYLSKNFLFSYINTLCYAIQI